MWYQFAEGQCEFPLHIDKYRYLTHGQSLTGVIVNVREILPYVDVESNFDVDKYLTTIYSIEDINPINITGKLEWNDEAQQVRPPDSAYGDGTVGYIRGEHSDLSTGMFTHYKLCINVPKLIEIWQWLKEPNSIFLGADSRGLTQVYITQRSAIVLEVVGWSNISITSNLALNYPRGIS
jgi:hypothetical protein